MANRGLFRLVIRTGRDRDTITAQSLSTGGTYFSLSGVKVNHRGLGKSERQAEHQAAVEKLVSAHAKPRL